jgi:hypothetical protein
MRTLMINCIFINRLVFIEEIFMKFEYLLLTDYSQSIVREKTFYGSYKNT